MACTWQLKGQGAANIVFAYCGDDPNLRGHVLRVRKPTAHVACDVDRMLWGSVFQSASDEGIQFELDYMTSLMAPLLGRSYVFPGVPVPVPAELHDMIGSGPTSAGTDTGISTDKGNCNGTPLPALILPDHTTFYANLAPGYRPVGPAVCLEIKPKWGLDPRQASCSQASGDSEAPATIPPAGDCEAGNGGEGWARQPEAESSSTECQLAPRSRPPGCMDLRRQYPRFMLHMLYKHVKSGEPLSLYNPLDLFSGKPERIEAALRCLLRTPSNNLAVFKDGIKIYGATGIKASSDDREGFALHETAALEQLARELQGFCEAEGVAPDDEHGRSNRIYWRSSDAPTMIKATGAATTTEAPGAAGEGLDCLHLSVPAGAETSTSVSEYTVLGDQRQRTSGQQLHSDNAVVLDILVYLTALVLHREGGLLSRLQQMQAMDQLGPENALKLYSQLLQGLQASENHEDVNGSGGTTAAASPSADAVEALRHYLMSATAKDCGIMVTLQRAMPTKPTRASSVDSGGEGGGEVTNGDSNLEREGQQGGCRSDCDYNSVDEHRQDRQHQQQQPPWAQVLEDPLSGATYMYKIALVDLDIKAVSKIPKHVELERSLIACAEAHMPLLRKLAQLSGWPS